MSNAPEQSPGGSGEPELIDLLHLGHPRVIGAWRVGDVIVDPGPSSCLPTLLPALESRRRACWRSPTYTSTTPGLAAQAMPLDQSFAGLARYLRKRDRPAG